MRRGLPLDAGVEAGNAHTSIGVPTGNFHLPDGLRGGSLGDLIDCSVVVWEHGDGTFIVLDVTVCEGLGIAAKGGVGCCGVEGNSSGLGGFVEELKKWNGAEEARQLASGPTGDAASEYAVVAIIEEDQRKLSCRVGRSANQGPCCA